MTAPTLVRAVELLERALGYTRGALATVPGVPLDAPTPCAAWTLDDLLAHMDDALDAFAESSGGAVAVTAGVPVHARLQSVQRKACDLLGAWSRTTADVVVVGGRPAPLELVGRAAALEITVHGWDVARATGATHPLPESLATALLPTAHALVDDVDRRAGPPGPTAPRFGRSVLVRPDATAATCLLAHLGRRG